MVDFPSSTFYRRIHIGTPNIWHLSVMTDDFLIQMLHLENAEFWLRDSQVKCFGFIFDLSTKI